MSAFVEIRNLVKRYSGNFTLDKISLELEKGETLTLMGPSGSGKTSLLRNISGLDMPDSGSIRIDGREVAFLPPSARGVGMIFQDLAIFPHMKVYDNIAYGLRAIKEKEVVIEERVEELATMLGISALLERYPGQISGGQRQRVALARSVAPSPKLLLLDEPMSSLDTQLRSTVRGEIKSFSRRIGLTMIYVTHDHNEGLYMADKAGVMYNGRMEEGVSTPRNIFMQPGSERTARFFGYNVVSINSRRLAFYPTDFEISDHDADLWGTVVSVGFEGEYNRVHVETEDGGNVQLEVTPGVYDSLEPGARIGIRMRRSEELPS